jgi:NadR type nicotinamide-nucleotide adenylyltransferase
MKSKGSDLNENNEHHCERSELPGRDSVASDHIVNTVFVALRETNRLALMPEKTKKVVVLGPECTGKSELSEFLARQFKTTWVKEFAREYLTNLPGSYVAQDLLEIAKGQLTSEDALAARANKVLICDTNLYVIKIWSLFKYGYCDPEILTSVSTRQYDLYLLTYIDIPWEADPQREHPGQREKLYNLYLKEMQNQTVPFIEVKGTREERRHLATKAIINLLDQANP